MKIDQSQIYIDKSTSNRQQEINCCLHEFFEQQVDRAPNDLCIVNDFVSLTYEQVDCRANQLAHYLAEQGIGLSDFVPVFLHPSELPIISILAILKCGAAYIPLDPSYPEDRIDYILDSAKVRLMLTQLSLEQRIGNHFSGEIICLDSISTTEFSQKRLYDVLVTPEDLCYILFTSGTTGRPKGIMTEHRNVVSFARSFNKVINLNSSDRIYQGFSLGFDGSVEEMWMAFSNGATLVVGSSETKPLADEAAKYMNKHWVSVFSTVPTFLGMLQTDLTFNRLIIVSGEPCPDELVKKWSNGNRRMLNVYGPTETTVNTTAYECLPGKEITIGRPLDGYDIFILDADLKPVVPGEKGELYIGGAGLARGYFKNEELTAKTFIQGPFDLEGSPERLYKSGDSVSLAKNGELYFYGRLDTQVKIRGNRVELAEIESVIREHEEITQAVVQVINPNGHNELAAFAVVKNPTTLLDQDGVLLLLKSRLPHYMIPTYLDVLAEIPMLASGKADRNSLPDPTSLLIRTNREIVEPKNEIERNIVNAIKAVLNIEEVSTSDDFFMDLAGYSLQAVNLIVHCRDNYNYNLSLSDIYHCLTVEKIALKVENSEKVDKLQSQSKRKLAKENIESASSVERMICWSLQALSLILLYGLGTTPFLLLVWMGIGVVKGTFALEAAALITAALVIFSYPATLLLSIAFKWIIVGRYKSGRYPLWGIYYFRVWLASKMQAMSGIGGIAGTPVMSLYYRLMGAKVGAGSTIDSSLCSIFDLVQIGSNTSIGAGTQMLGFRIEDGEMVIGSLSIGDNCYVGSHSSLGLNSVMENGARLDDLSMLPDDEVIPSGEGRRGSPAEKASVDLSELGEREKQKHSPFWIGLWHFLALDLVGIMFLSVALPLLSILVGSYIKWGIPGVLGALVVDAALGPLLFCIMVALFKKVILAKTIPGVYSNQSFYYFRKWIVDLFLTASSTVVHSLYTTIYLPHWLRMLGTKIGKRAEISTITSMSPDLTEIGDESFFADGSFIGGRRFYNGKVLFDRNKIGNRSFVGNNAMLPIGESLGDNCLLGVLSAPSKESAKKVPDGSEWLGSPAFKLPHRKKIEDFDLSTTYKPTLKLYIQRCIIDGLRIVIPNYIGLAGFITYIYFLYYSITSYGMLTTILLSPLVATALTVLTALLIPLMKRIVMGTFKPEIKPLWCTYIWWNEMINGIYETIAAPLMAPMMGTPFYNWFLRLMGVKIGKFSYIGTSLFSEFDMVEIGDYCALNSGMIPQNHLFEDRVFKSSTIKIEDECSIGHMAVILYDTVLKRGTKVDNMSLVMKGESLPEKNNWKGIPIRRE